jgi:hypothetical protein
VTLGYRLGYLCGVLAGPEPPRVPIQGGYNLVGTVKGCRQLRLADLGLWTGDPGTGLACGLNPRDADNLITCAPGGALAVYFPFCFELADFEGWYTSGYEPADDVLIGPGTAFFIYRKEGRPPFWWTIPPE